ncbi:MAG: hypothetical protein QM734_07020 [Cyclobacteriaceae bacterium]
MGSTSESGVATLLASFEKVVNAGSSLGTGYSPSNPLLKVTALNTQLGNAQTAVQNYNVAKLNYDTVTNTRDLLFKTSPTIITRIINTLAACGANKETIKDGRFFVRKLRGGRVKAVAKPGTTEPTPEGTDGTSEESAPKINSVSQQSFEFKTEYFSQLVLLVSAEPKYNPSEADLKVTALNTLLTDMKVKNSAVISAANTLSVARINRDKALYDPNTGLVVTGLGVKTTIKGAYGTKSPQYKMVANLKFVNKRKS